MKPLFKVLDVPSKLHAVVKNLPASAGDTGSLGWEDPLQ